MKKVENLRKKYPRFVYENYAWKISKGNLEISFDFKIESAENRSPHIYFKPKVVIKNVKKSQVEKVGPEPQQTGYGVKNRVIDNLVFNLGLIEMLSYWKATCSPEILVKAGFLNPEQIRWWKDLINRGMGQFFFENKINFLKPNFIKIKTIETAFHLKNAIAEISNKNRVLVPVGGGKDSVVTLEILKRTNKNISCFSLNPTGAAKKIMKMASTGSPQIAGCKNPVIAEREIDSKLLELNRKGFLNGHTPFSAYLAFLSVLIAILFDQKYIAFSNERGANEGNVKYLGRVINHQYSKSFDFEKKFRRYSQKYLTSGVQYFSFLRPLFEIQIAKLFSKYPKYFRYFISCNEAFKTYSGKRKPTRNWCGKCPKCLFVFAILYPFLGKYRFAKIFGENLFKKIPLLPIMLELIGERKFKPFECVGTKKESLIAFYLAFRSFKRRRVKLPFLLSYLEKNVLPKYPDLERKSKKLLNSWSNQHNLSKEFEKVLKNSQR